MDKTEKASISMEIAGNNSGILGEISAGRDITINNYIINIDEHLLMKIIELIKREKGVS